MRLINRADRRMLLALLGIFAGSTSTRARELVSSGLIDLAAEITALSHHLTDTVMAMLDADYSEHDIFIADYCALRSAVWEGIACGLTERLAKR